MLLNRERALAMMERHGVDALVATSAPNVYYLSNYYTEHLYAFSLGGFAGAVLPRDPSKPPTLVIQEWELPQLTENPSWMPETRVLTGFDLYAPEEAEIGPSERRLLELIREGRRRGSDNRQRALGAVLREQGLDRSRVAFDEPATWEELREHDLPELHGISAANLFREIRNVKTPEEVRLLRHAALINETALRNVANILTAGATPSELMRLYRASMAEQGGYGSHMTGGGGAHPWLSHPNMSYRYKEGDIVYLDPAGHYRRYWGDIGRAAIVGEPTDKLTERYRRLQDCHRTIVPMLRAGTRSQDVIAEARRSVEHHIHGGFVPLIHSIGLEHYDHPQSLGTFLSENFDLEAGMVVNFETLYFELGWGLIQLEDTYLISEADPERFQMTPQQPYVCPVFA